MSQTPSTNDDNPPKHHPPTTPLPPRWRFVADAKKAHGYSTADAGRRVDGLSAEELAAKYQSPSFSRSVCSEGDDVEVGRLTIVEGRSVKRERLTGSFPGFGENDSFESEERIRTCDWSDVDSRSSSDENDMSSSDYESPDESSGESELDTTGEVSTEFIGEVTVLSAGSRECFVGVQEDTTVDSQDSVEEQINNEVEQSTCLDVDGSFAQAISPENPYESSNAKQSRKKCAFGLLLLLLCVLAVTMGLIYGIHQVNPSENENSLKNLIFLSNNATANPSVSPSWSIMPSLRPTSICSENATRFVIKTMQQNVTGWLDEEIFARDTIWKVREACTGDIVMECQPCTHDTNSNLFDHMQNSAEQCLDSGKKYIFEIQTGENGSCCGFATSKFTVYFDDNVVVKRDASKQTTAFRTEFGSQNPCPMESPSVLPSLEPTVSDSELPSIMPSQQLAITPSKQPSSKPSYQPTCDSQTNDFNLCFALDMSGSVCNRGTGFECNACEPALVCNADGVSSNSCCTNFMDVIEFTKGMVTALSELEASQTYSVVRFATNASLVSSVTSSNRTLVALDDIVYDGGCKYIMF